MNHYLLGAEHWHLFSKKCKTIFLQIKYEKKVIVRGVNEMSAEKTDFTSDSKKGE